MKPSLAFYIGALLLAGALAGCGQPGALYLPKVPGQAAKPATAPANDSSNDSSNAPGVPPDYAPSPSSSSSPAPQR